MEENSRLVPISDQFLYNGIGPVDAKSAPVETAYDLPTSLRAYEGLRVFVKDEGVEYIYKKSAEGALDWVKCEGSDVDIKPLSGSVVSLSATVEDMEDEISANTEDIAELSAATVALEGEVSANTEDIAELSARTGELEDEIAELSAKTCTIVASGDAYVSAEVASGNNLSISANVLHIKDIEHPVITAITAETIEVNNEQFLMKRKNTLDEEEYIAWQLSNEDGDTQILYTSGNTLDTMPRVGDTGVTVYEKNGEKMEILTSAVKIVAENAEYTMTQSGLADAAEFKEEIGFYEKKTLSLEVDGASYVRDKEHDTELSGESYYCYSNTEFEEKVYVYTQTENIEANVPFDVLVHTSDDPESVYNPFTIAVTGVTNSTYETGLYKFVDDKIKNNVSNGYIDISTDPTVLEATVKAKYIDFTGTCDVESVIFGDDDKLYTGLDRYPEKDTDDMYGWTLSYGGLKTDVCYTKVIPTTAGEKMPIYDIYGGCVCASTIAVEINPIYINTNDTAIKNADKLPLNEVKTVVYANNQTANEDGYYKIYLQNLNSKDFRATAYTDTAISEIGDSFKVYTYDEATSAYTDTTAEITALYINKPVQYKYANDGLAIAADVKRHFKTVEDEILSLSGRSSEIYASGDSYIVADVQSGNTIYLSANTKSIRDIKSGDTGSFLADAIDVWNVIDEDEKAIARSLNDLNDRAIVMSGDIKDIKDELGNISGKTCTVYTSGGTYISAEVKSGNTIGISANTMSVGVGGGYEAHKRMATEVWEDEDGNQISLAYKDWDYRRPNESVWLQFYDVADPTGLTYVTIAKTAAAIPSSPLYSNTVEDPNTFGPTKYTKLVSYTQENVPAKDGLALASNVNSTINSIDVKSTNNYLKANPSLASFETGLTLNVKSIGEVWLYASSGTCVADAVDVKNYIRTLSAATPTISGGTYMEIEANKGAYTISAKTIGLEEITSATPIGSYLVDAKDAWNIIKEDEEGTARALNDLNDRIIEASGDIEEIKEELARISGGTCNISGDTYISATTSGNVTTITANIVKIDDASSDVTAETVRVVDEGVETDYRVTRLASADVSGKTAWDNAAAGMTVYTDKIYALGDVFDKVYYIDDDEFKTLDGPYTVINVEGTTNNGLVSALDVKNHLDNINVTVSGDSYISAETKDGVVNLSANVVKIDDTDSDVANFVVNGITLVRDKASDSEGYYGWTNNGGVLLTKEMPVLNNKIDIYSSDKSYKIFTDTVTEVNYAIVNGLAEAYDVKKHLDALVTNTLNIDDVSATTLDYEIWRFVTTITTMDMKVSRVKSSDESGYYAWLQDGAEQPIYTDTIYRKGSTFDTIYTKDSEGTFTAVTGYNITVLSETTKYATPSGLADAADVKNHLNTLSAKTSTIYASGDTIEINEEIKIGYTIANVKSGDTLYISGHSMCIDDAEENAIVGFTFLKDDGTETHTFTRRKSLNTEISYGWWMTDLECILHTGVSAITVGDTITLYNNTELTSIYGTGTVTAVEHKDITAIADALDVKKHFDALSAKTTTVYASGDTTYITADVVSGNTIGISANTVAIDSASSEVTSFVIMGITATREKASDSNGFYGWELGGTAIVFTKEMPVLNATIVIYDVDKATVQFTDTVTEVNYNTVTGLADAYDVKKHFDALSAKTTTVYASGDTTYITADVQSGNTIGISANTMAIDDTYTEIVSVIYKETTASTASLLYRAKEYDKGKGYGWLSGTTVYYSNNLPVVNQRMDLYTGTTFFVPTIMGTVMLINTTPVTGLADAYDVKNHLKDLVSSAVTDTPIYLSNSVSANTVITDARVVKLEVAGTDYSTFPATYAGNPATATSLNGEIVIENVTYHTYQLDNGAMFEFIDSMPTSASSISVIEVNDGSTTVEYVDPSTITGLTGTTFTFNIFGTGDTRQVTGLTVDYSGKTLTAVNYVKGGKSTQIIPDLTNLAVTTGLADSADVKSTIAALEDRIKVLEEWIKNIKAGTFGA